MEEKHYFFNKYFLNLRIILIKMDLKFILIEKLFQLKWI